MTCQWGDFKETMNCLKLFNYTCNTCDCTSAPHNQHAEHNLYCI